ncbi:hypothetical protein D3C80_685810 [compost metagenome]
MAVAIDHQGQGHVVEHGSVHQQPVILKDHPDLAAHIRDLAALDLADVIAMEEDATIGRPLHHADELEEGTLARPRMAGQEGHLPLAQVEADLLQRLMATAVYLADLVKTDHNGFLILTNPDLGRGMEHLLIAAGLIHRG